MCNIRHHVSSPSIVQYKKALQGSPDFGAERRKRKSTKSNKILLQIYSSLKGIDDMFMFTIFVQILPWNITIFVVNAC